MANTPLTKDVVSALRLKTHMGVNDPRDRAINYLADEWLQQRELIEDLQRQIAELMEIDSDTV